MVKSQQLEVEQEPIVAKKPLNKFLPYEKYVDVKARTYKKRLSTAIKEVHLDKMLIKSAVQNLVKYANENQSATDLALKQEYVYVVIDLSRIPEQHSVRPIQIALPYPIYSPELKSRYTIISSNQNQQTLSENFDTLNVPMLREIVSYDKIKKNYKNIQDKKQLLAANDLFFCDWKVYNLLRQPLGKAFYEQKKYPFPIDCDGNVPAHLQQIFPTYEAYINGLANFTYTMLGNGPVYTIKAGKTTMGTRELVKNIIHGAYGLIANLLDSQIKVHHVRQISIKTYNSPSLPIYNFLSKQQIAEYKKSTAQTQSQSQSQSP